MGTLISTPEDINKFRLLTLKSALKLEIVGMRRRGRSAYTIIKQEFNLKGSKTKVLEQFEKLIESM
jgi:hypothetical protein|tara:strand:+ start:315 stop:512 length:198 start_codon:yes stop_codon:yes gene_type:complete